MTGRCLTVPDALGICVDATALELANTADQETLKGYGVYYTGASGLVAERPFATLDDVDAVPGMGPASMEALLQRAESDCRVQVVFSPQSYGDSHLARVTDAIDASVRSLDIAMYSFSDAGVKEAVLDAAKRGVSVRAVLEKASEDRNDPAGTLSAQLEDAGIEVRWVNKIMHHKYVLIDGPRTDVREAAEGLLVSGSGNWSYSAGTKYDEDTLFVRDERLLLAFQREFELMWVHGRPVEWNETIPSVEGLDLSLIHI